MSKVWPADTIRELLARANLNGCAKATLSSNRSARLFRFAIYSWRKAQNIGQDLSITIDDKTIIVRKIEPQAITILQEIEGN